jgi:mannitol/fructose-specific phosphotransferase system IIA component (Ntr-type)
MVEARSGSGGRLGGHIEMPRRKASNFQAPATPELRQLLAPGHCPLAPATLIWYIRERLGDIGVISRKAVEYLRAAIFVRSLDADSEYEAISKMLGSLQGHAEVQDWQKLSAAVFDRQQTERSLFPGGIAFPHARIDCVSSLVMVIATCSKPIPFGEMPVRLIFLIGIPKRAGAEYLELISFLARHVRGEHVIDRLVQAEDMSTFLGGFAEGA